MPDSVAMPHILDQGGLGTCTAFAFAAVLCNALLMKYRVVISPSALVEKLKALVPCWDGAKLDDFCALFGGRKRTAGAWLDDGMKRYLIKVTAKKFSSIQETYEELKQMSFMHMLGTIRTSTAGHGLHAVCLAYCYPEAPGMQAINSWGTTHALLDVTAENFVESMAITPIIRECKSFPDKPEAVPSVNLLFASQVAKVHSKPLKSIMGGMSSRGGPRASRRTRKTDKEDPKGLDADVDMKEDEQVHVDGQSKGEVPLTTWPCPRCTFLNDLTQKECEICGGDRDAASSDAVIVLGSPTAKEVSTPASSGMKRKTGSEFLASASSPKKLFDGE